MRRRTFIKAIAGSAAFWPLAVRAEENTKRRIGILMPVAKDLVTEERITTFQQELEKLGWSVGGNLELDVRWAEANLSAISKFAAELVALPCDVIIAEGGNPADTLHQTTRTIPIVFVLVVDPVAKGLVDSLDRPGGNVTGFTQFEYALSGKWLELLKQIAPRVTRIAVLRDPSFSGQYEVIEAAARLLGFELAPPIGVNDINVIEKDIAAFASTPNGGLIVTASQYAATHHALIVSLAKRYGLPATYPYRYFADDGGLLSYGTDDLDQFRLAASYVDRILKGEKPADLPVQTPTKFELVINLKTAKMLGLTVSQILLAAANEVIE